MNAVPTQIGASFRKSKAPAIGFLLARSPDAFDFAFTQGAEKLHLNGEGDFADVYKAARKRGKTCRQQ
ncbi:MAG: hypothetical protein WCA44_16865 [Acidobacteriaceae bacterium]